MAQIQDIAKLALLGSQQPESLARLMAEKGVVPPMVIPGQNSTPVNFSDAGSQTIPDPGAGPAGGSAPGGFLDGLTKALSGVQAPATPEVQFQPQAPGGPGAVGGLGGFNLNPQIMQQILGLLKPQGSASPAGQLGSLINGR